MGTQEAKFHRSCQNSQQYQSFVLGNNQTQECFYNCLLLNFWAVSVSVNQDLETTSMPWNEWHQIDLTKRNIALCPNLFNVCSQVMSLQHYRHYRHFSKNEACRVILEKPTIIFKFTKQGWQLYNNQTERHTMRGESAVWSNEGNHISEVSERRLGILL